MKFKFRTFNRKSPSRGQQDQRRKRRPFLGQTLLCLFILFSLGAASVPPRHDLLTQIHGLTAERKFDFVDWMSQALAGELQRRFARSPFPPSAAEQRALVETFLAQESRIRSLKHEIDQMYAASDSPGQAVATMEQALAEREQAQSQTAPLVEMILSRQVETVLREEGFGLERQLFPPVAFRLIDPPTVLIISPRDRIENRHLIGLQPSLDHAVRTEIENSLHQRGDVSSYVTDIGGLASFPTMVISTDNFPALIDIVVHEWAHNYFYTFPTNLAWGYQRYPRLTTINETAATIVGQEISRKVITRYYPDWIDRLPPLAENGRPAPGEPSEFHLAMRRIRQQVDTLLAEGKIEEAEAYMEEERLKLVDQGYTLRRLNQAYFAFHGSYALSPGSVDPIGPQIRQLRAESGSLKEFLNRVAWLNSYDDFRLWLEESDLAYRLK